MNKIFKNIFLFLLFLGVFYFGGLYLLSSLTYNGKPAAYFTNDYYVWKGGGTFEKFKERDSLLNKDVIVVGSSRAYRSYNPSIFKEYGYSMWNLGSSAQRIENTLAVTKNVIIPARPKVILLDVARLGFEQESIESSIDLITNSSDLNLRMEIATQKADVRLLNTFFVSNFTTEAPSLYSDREYKQAGFSTRKDSLNITWLNKLEKNH